MGLLLLVPLGTIYGVLRLPVYHSWGIAHGSFTTAVSALAAASYAALGLLPWFQPKDTAPRIVASLSVLALVTVLFWVDQASNHELSLRHLAVYLALFALFTVLCTRAKRPLLIPFFLLVPLLIDPAFGILVTGSFDSMGAELFGHDLRQKVLPALVATGASIGAAKLIRKRDA